MTRSIAAHRSRWIASLGATAFLALALLVAFLAGSAQLNGAVSSDGPATAGAPSPAISPSGSSAALDPRIASLAAHHPQRVIETIVQFKASVGPERARWDVSRLSGRVIADLHIINALAVKLTAERARWLAANPDVHAVSLNAAVTPEGGPGHGPGKGPGDGPARLRHRHISPGSVAGIPLQTTFNQTLDTSDLWPFGINGSGVGVAVIDTGIAGDLPDFQGSPGSGSRVVETAVTNPGATTATDDYGHGTVVAGILAGNGDNRPPSDPLRGQFMGVAPHANLISIKASDDQGNATVLDVIYGLQFAVDHQADYNIRVVNLSLDSVTPQPYQVDPLDAAAEAAWFHGIVVVAAAGNRGLASDAVQYAPANDPYVITVGATNENGTANPADDFVASWSSRGVTQDGFHKPDVYAPGAHIVSVLAPSSAFAAMCSACQVGTEYIRTSGTSMATPMIAGVVADVLQVHPTWTPNQVKGALTSPNVAALPGLQEVDAGRMVALLDPPRADGGLTPNQLIDPSTGGIDYTRSSWSRSSWSQATGSLNAGFARSSWSCSCGASSASGAGSSGGADPSRSSWSRSSWSMHLDPTGMVG